MASALSFSLPDLFTPLQSKSILAAPVNPRTSISFIRNRRSTVSALGSRSNGGKRRYKGTIQREERLTHLIEKKVAEAMEVCEGEKGNKDSEGCRVAWDEVEEISQAKADFRRRLAECGRADPLESFCQGNPDSDECVIYEDD